MAYTVREIAKLSGVSVRTLHYYDEIDLLKPAFYGENGYRFYEEPELLRLQQILFFRELDVPLEHIQLILKSNQFDQIEALNSHRRLLAEKGKRIESLLDTIDKTIKHLRGEITMPHQEMYEGFINQQKERFSQALKDKYGDKAEEVLAKERERFSQLNFDDLKGESDRLNAQMVSAIERNLVVSDPEVQEVVRWQYQLSGRLIGHTPTKEEFVRLGDTNTEDPALQSFIESIHPGLARYMRDAVRFYAETNLN